MDAMEMGITVTTCFKKRNFFTKVFNKIDKKINTSFSKFFWNDWKKNLNNYELVLIYSNYYSRSVIKYLNAKYPDIRILVWYNNPVSTDTPLSFFKDLNCEIWSFDEEDCKRYELKYNNQFIDYSRLNPTEKFHKKYNYDACFIGLDKGRLNTLNNIKRKLSELGKDTLLYLVDSKYYVKDDRYNSSTTFNYKVPIKYSEVINYEFYADIIIDVVQEGQKGVSLRPIESIYLKKKVISNNKEIINQDFYNDSNYFIWGEDDINKLSQFLNVPYREQPEEIIEKYRFRGWFNNML
ncbi:lipopolysaccharide biosynthesis protein [Enterococcus durans]|nr:lipopolysaccharide biosynthesis protein [Enterococcus durans]